MQSPRKVGSSDIHSVAVPECKRRLVGVLGGMGPLATVDFLAKVVALTPATCDQEHVPLIVHQVPQIPDRSTAILNGSDAPYLAMLSGLKRLKQAGAQFAVIPCNSAHHWYERLAREQSLDILHIADAVRQEIDHRFAGSRRIAILATRGTNQAGVYARRLGGHFESALPLDESTQLLIDRAIVAVKAGARKQAARVAGDAVNCIQSAGADVLILACTELPVALANNPVQAVCIDSTLALARSCVKEALRDSAEMVSDKGTRYR